MNFVADTAELERHAVGSVGPLTVTAAESMYKLMAYKDEYETARLFLDPGFEQSVRETFGDDASFAYKLHPPMLRAMGLDHKLTLGAWFKPALYALRTARRVRGTRLDVFGYAHVRQVERSLVDDYAKLTREVVPRATQGNIDAIREILGLAQEVRGYESIKMANVESYRRKVAAALDALSATAAVG